MSHISYSLISMSETRNSLIKRQFFVTSSEQFGTVLRFTVKNPHAIIVMLKNVPKLHTTPF